jgi:hypothetical protein
MVSPPSAPNLRSVANKQTNRKRHHRSRDNAATVLGRMRREHLTLHCEHDNRRGRLAWHLSDGTEVSDQLGHELIRHPNIKPAGDALPFSKGESTSCQIYRFLTGLRDSRKETTMVALTSKTETSEQKEPDNV